MSFKSAIWFIPKEEFQEKLNISVSIKDFLKRNNIKPSSGNHKTLVNRIKKEGFNLDKLNKNRIDYVNKGFAKYSDDEVFVKNKYHNVSNLKKRLIKFGVEYKCTECGIGNVYNNKTLSLHLDHINGINDDNRKENLRFLCPNCHSQTETFGSKKKKKEIKE